MEFKVGDIVEFGGLRAKVVSNTDTYYPIKIIYDHNPLKYDIFTLDGRIYIEQTKPLLVLIERPKKKVTKTLEGWVNVYNTHTRHTSLLYDSDVCAEAGKGSDRVSCVKVTGTYEVEE